MSVYTTANSFYFRLWGICKLLSYLNVPNQYQVIYWMSASKSTKMIHVLADLDRICDIGYCIKNNIQLPIHQYFSTLKSRFVMMPTLSILSAKVVFLATSCATNDDKFGIMITHSFLRLYIKFNAMFNQLVNKTCSSKWKKYKTHIRNVFTM